MKKNAVAIILALCMVIAMLPMTAQAAPAKQGTAQFTAAAEPMEPMALPEAPAETNGKYNVTLKVISGSSHGEVELGASSGDRGDVIPVLINPDNGYLAEVSIEYYYDNYTPDLVYAGLDIWALEMGDGDVTIEVKFVAAEGSSRSVNVSVNNTSGGTAKASRTSARPEESVFLYVTVKTGYYVDSVEVSSSNGDNVYGGYLGVLEGQEVYEIFMPKGKLNIKVNFAKEKPYTIKASVTHIGGTVSVNKSTAYAGEEFILTCTPDQGYKVNYIDCRCWPDVIPLTQINQTQWKGVMPKGNVNIDVTFTLISYDVSVKVTDPALGTATLNKTSAQPGETVTLTCTPTEGYRVDKITGADMTAVSENVFTFTMPEKAVELTVSFKTIYNPVSVTVDTGLGGTASVDLTEAKAGDTVTLTCAPEEGYRVAQITGADLTDNGDNTYTFPMPDEAVELHVLFLRENNPFLDVNETHFFYESVLWAVEEGITNGIDDTHFGPMQNTNRAAVVTMLWRYAGSPEPSAAGNPFTDVPAGSWYEAPVLWAVENGITNGIDDTHFGPNMACNRAQVVTFLYRFWNACAPEGVANPFEDVPAGEWYEAPVLWALANNITTGADATHFNPTGNCLRAQFVTFLYRAKDIAFYHNVEAAADETMGTISLSHTTAQAGTVVTATVTPNEGFLIESVACLSGAEVTQVSDTEYTFVMADEDEIFQVNFAQIPAEPDPSEPTDPTEPEEPTDPEEPGQTYELVLKTNGPGIVRYVDKNFAAPGESIFFYAIPNEGCYLSRVSILNPNGEIDESKIQLFAHDNDLYELVMIDHQMVLTFHFMPLPA